MKNLEHSVWNIDEMKSEFEVEKWKLMNEITGFEKREIQQSL